MKRRPGKGEVERAVAAAFALSQKGGIVPHTVIDDLIGLEAYRHYKHCPDVETLAAYAEEGLPLESTLRVAEHETQCPVCQADIADLRRFVRQQITQVLAATPVWVTPFVGREEIRATLKATWTTGNIQKLLLMAPAGNGKTRMIVETAVEYAYLFPDGVWYVSASGAADPVQAAAEIARAVQLPLQPKVPPLAQLQDYFADKRALLILDDITVESHADIVSDLSRRAPDLCCLLTAAKATGLPVEQTIVLPPLKTSAQTQDASPLLSGESERLFLEHVRTFHADYAPEESEARSIASLCECAWGIPFAIELAAARAREMSPGEMLAQMEASGFMSVRPQRALKDLMAWSYNLLSGQEQGVLNALSVFADRFGIEQAVEVCRTEDAPHIIERLHQAAFLQRLESYGQPRYRLLTPVRTFARERLGTRQEQTQRRHAIYFLDFAQQRADRLESAQQVEALQDMSGDLPNLRAAMDWAQEAGEWPLVGRYGVALSRFLLLHGFWQECDARLHMSLAAYERDPEALGKEQAQLALARSLTLKGEYEAARPLFQAILAQAGPQKAPSLRGEALRGLGNVAGLQGHDEEATQRYEELLEHCRAHQDRWGMADSWQNLGWLALMQGDYPHAKHFLLASLAIQRERGDRYRIGTTLANLGNIAYEQGQWKEARLRFEESLQVRREVGDVRGQASAITNLGRVWQASGAYARADYCYAQAISMLERLGARPTQAQVMLCQGELALARNDLLLARQQFQSARELFEAVGDTHGMAQALAYLERIAVQP